jgi:hypothetical protein
MGERYGMVFAFVLERPELDLGDRAVYCALAVHRNYKTGRCDPSNKKICKSSGLGLRAVQNHKRNLERFGVMTLTRRKGRTSQYRLAMSEEERQANMKFYESAGKCP